MMNSRLSMNGVGPTIAPVRGRAGVRRGGRQRQPQPRAPEDAGRAKPETLGVRRRRRFHRSSSSAAAAGRRPPVGLHTRPARGSTIRYGDEVVTTAIRTHETAEKTVVGHDQWIGSPPASASDSLATSVIIAVNGGEKMFTPKWRPRPRSRREAERGDGSQGSENAAAPRG